MIEIEADFPRGECPLRAFGALEDNAAPVVLFFMDGFGPRPALYAMAERLAEEGYRVVLPHLFYDHLPSPPLDVTSVLSGGADRDRMTMMLSKLDQAKVDADVGALLQIVETRFGHETLIGAVGYCMGGRYAMTAATLSPRVRLGASFHGATLAPEQGDSAYKRLDGVAASIYVGIAANDPMFGAEEEGRLAAALRKAGVDHSLETYAGTAHGFCMSDLPIYSHAATERHWRQLTTRLNKAFGRPNNAGPTV